jgi:hypothetical protein
MDASTRPTGDSACNRLEKPVAAYVIVHLWALAIGFGVICAPANETSRRCTLPRKKRDDHALLISSRSCLRVGRAVHSLHLGAARGTC